MESTVTTWQGPYSCPDCLIDHAKLADPCSACKRVAGTVAPRTFIVNFHTDKPFDEAQVVKAFKRIMAEVVGQS